MQATVFSLHTPLISAFGLKGQLFFSSESGHVAYQIEGNEVLNNMQANILVLYTPLTAMVWLKINY